MGFLASLQWHAATQSLTCSHTSVLQVELYADYAPGQLMAFLVSSQWYGLEEALQVCEQRGLVREQVFILGRMGSASQALHLIIQRLADIPQVLHSTPRHTKHHEARLSKSPIADIPQVLHATPCHINYHQEGRTRAVLLTYPRYCMQHPAPSSQAKKQPHCCDQSMCWVSFGVEVLSQP